MEYPVVILKQGRDASLRRNHHWIFSGGIQKINGNPKEGDLVQITSTSTEILGYGHYNDSTISIRILQFGSQLWSDDFWHEKLNEAYGLRNRLDLIKNSNTNAYRLVHGEGDGMPGLIIDIYGSHAVIQCHSLGMYKNITLIADALKKIYGNQLITIYNKSKEAIDQLSHLAENNFLHGDTSETIILEHGHSFIVNWVTGQKTGFFLDQRENRKQVGAICKGKSVLNLFSYSGGFSIYALEGEASSVDSVDVSNKAIELTDMNVALLKANKIPHQSHAVDVNKFLAECNMYDMIICDPPAFAKSLNKRHQALIGYKNLNAKVIKKVNSGGLLFTFSCSQVMDRELFQQTILAAALESNRKVKILQHLSQGPDHPTNIYHPEGSYLKGLMLYIED
ncbi:MAG: class I SAM-dependent rRNA methyltransferase [Saprospiraceae bacterium]